MSTKTCTDCGTDLPLDAMHYDRDRNASDGFRDVCKLCRKEQREQSLKEKRAPGEVMRSVEDEALDVLDKLSPERGGISVPHMLSCSRRSWMRSADLRVWRGTSFPRS